MTQEEREIQWVKTGTGVHYLKRASGKNERIKPGQRFWAKPSEIPKTFRDVIKPVSSAIPEEPQLQSTTKFELKEKPLDELSDEQKKLIEEVQGDRDAIIKEATENIVNTAGTANATDVKEAHDIVPRGASGWYDVINNATGKIINETALREPDAKELKRSLDGE